MRMSQDEYDALMKKRVDPLAPAVLPKRRPAHAVHTSGKMNKTEAAYAGKLEGMKRTGEVAWYKFEAVTLKLADRARYTPDFAVEVASGELEMHEVKGFWRDDALVKIKVAAAMFPFRFVAVQAKSKKDGGGWKVEIF